MKEILKVKDLSVNNNSVKILKNISFNIKKGEILGIVGESGCGKSTLIRTLIQMMNKSEEIISGEILFNERNLLSLDSKQIRKLRGNNLAVIFQNPGATLNPIRKIGKQLVQTMQSHMNINKNEALEKAANMLEKVNLKDSKCILNSYPFELSGGMKQRVTIALAMILEPMPKGIKGNPPLFTENITGCSFAPRCEKCNEVCIKNQQYLKKMHDGRYIACDYVEDVEKKYG